MALDWWVGFSIAISAFWVVILILSCLRCFQRRAQRQRQVTQVNTTVPTVVVGAPTMLVGGYKPPGPQVHPYPGQAAPPPSYTASTMYPPPYSADPAYPLPSAPISSVSGTQNPYYNTGYTTDYGQGGVQQMAPPAGPPQPWVQPAYNPHHPGTNPTYSYHQPAPTAGYTSGQLPGYSP